MELRHILAGFLQAALIGGVLIVSLLFNVYIHELGHFAVASAFNLNPELHIDGAARGLAFAMNGEPIAWTAYSSISTKLQDIYVTMAGPIANLLLSAMLGLTYFIVPKRKRKILIQLLFITAILPAIMAFVGNIIPTAGNDGSILLSLLRGL